MREKINLIKYFLKNFRLIWSFREFFLYYLIKISDLSRLPKEKKYIMGLDSYPTGFFQREFLFYSPKLSQRTVQLLSESIFRDDKSRKLYSEIFMINAYSSHFVKGWEKYLLSEKDFKRNLKNLTLSINSKVIFKGNYFISEDTTSSKEFSVVISDKLYKLSLNWFEISVFLKELGLPNLSKKYLNNLKKKTIIDVGAFIGDSSIILARYTDMKVLAFEPSFQNYHDLVKTINLNHLEQKISPFQLALGKNKKNISIGFGAGASVSKNVKGYIKQIPLDSMDLKKYPPIGLIKMDVEGYEMDVLLGAEKLIKRDRPLLFVSIYHGGEQFIEVPRYLSERFSDIYDFLLFDNNPTHPLAEKMLVALPKNA